MTKEETELDFQRALREVRAKAAASKSAIVKQGETKNKAFAFNAIKLSFLVVTEIDARGPGSDVQVKTEVKTEIADDEGEESVD